MSVESYSGHNHPYSFPTRRSSDVRRCRNVSDAVTAEPEDHPALHDRRRVVDVHDRLPRDRKSTRLNSSHVATSYADFCLKKKAVKRTRKAYERAKRK